MRPLAARGQATTRPARRSTPTRFRPTLRSCRLAAARESAWVTSLRCLRQRLLPQCCCDAIPSGLRATPLMLAWRWAPQSTPPTGCTCASLGASWVPQQLRWVRQRSLKCDARVTHVWQAQLVRAELAKVRNRQHASDGRTLCLAIAHAQDHVERNRMEGVVHHARRQLPTSTISKSRQRWGISGVPREVVMERMKWKAAEWNAVQLSRAQRFTAQLGAVEPLRCAGLAYTNLEARSWRHKAQGSRWIDSLMPLIVLLCSASPSACCF
mmetsp:Transcript_15053/g.44358  ORF Transcript_15053/g.44358 Transcript_15053/m.44358 type:complete len:268 (+) Transcript_15053:1255-2058(+)